MVRIIYAEAARKRRNWTVRSAAMALVPAGGHGVMLWAPARRAAKQNFGPDLTKHPPDRLPGRRCVRPPAGLSVSFAT